MKKALFAALSLLVATAAFAGTVKTFRATYIATVNGILYAVVGTLSEGDVVSIAKSLR